MYYYNNLLRTIVLSKLCVKHKVQKFVFSSSATVYGNQVSPLKEDMELKKTINPYGETKSMSERILTDTAKANSAFAVSIICYLNPVGAHSSGLVGEDPNGIPMNLVPLISKVAARQLKKLSVFGNDYDTIDGTGVRDYIHVVVLAKGHVKAIEKLTKGVNIYNLGTVKGTSVFELVKVFMKVNHVKVPYEIVERRLGDISISYADCSKAEKELKWIAELGIEEMVQDAWNFQTKKMNHYFPKYWIVTL
jgi:UDP-glucose 4-epimerase